MKSFRGHPADIRLLLKRSFSMLLRLVMMTSNQKQGNLIGTQAIRFFLFIPTVARLKLTRFERYCNEMW